MKRIKVSELTGAALDWAVAKCEHGNLFMEPYSTSWAQGGPIIEWEWVELAVCSDQWGATIHLENGSIYAEGQTALVAAMRCYVASKLGDTVEVPEGLC